MACLCGCDSCTRHRKPWSNFRAVSAASWRCPPPPDSVAGMLDTLCGDTAAFYMLRELDPTIEAAFGFRKCEHGPDALHLGKALQGRAFDLVFARHMQPKLMRHLDQVAESAASVVKPNDIGLFGIDRGTRNRRDLYLVRPSGQIRCVHATGGPLGLRLLCSDCFCR